MIILGDGCGYFLVLKNFYSKKVFKGRYTQVYWQDIPQLLENCTLIFDARREKVRD